MIVSEHKEKTAENEKPYNAPGSTQQEPECPSRFVDPFDPPEADGKA